MIAFLPFSLLSPSLLLKLPFIAYHLYWSPLSSTTQTIKEFFYRDKPFKKIPLNSRQNLFNIEKACAKISKITAQGFHLPGHTIKLNYGHLKITPHTASAYVRLPFSSYFLHNILHQENLHRWLNYTGSYEVKDQSIFFALALIGGFCDLQNESTSSCKLSGASVRITH